MVSSQPPGTLSSLEPNCIAAPPELEALSLTEATNIPRTLLSRGPVESQSFESTTKQGSYPRPAKAQKSGVHDLAPKDPDVSNEPSLETGTMLSPHAIPESRAGVLENSTHATLEAPKPLTAQPSRYPTPTLAHVHSDDTPQSPSLPKVCPLLKPNGSESDPQTAGTQKDDIQDVPRTTFTSSTVPVIKPGLTNPIHPILAQEHWLGHGEHYEIIKPTLRLVSRLFRLDAVTKHIVVMADGEIRRDTKPWGAGVKTDFDELANLKDAQGQPLKPNIGRYSKPDQEVVDDPMRRRAAQILGEGEDLMRFIFGKVPDGFIGATQRPGRWWAGSFQPSELHRASVISISETLVDEIVGASRRRQRSQRATDVEWDLQVHQIRLASTILNEIFHALETAHNRPPVKGDTETFYGDCLLAECGFAGVAAAFGGTLGFNTQESKNIIWSLLQYPQLPDPLRGYGGTSLELLNWPSSLCYHKYKDDPSFGIRETSTPLGLDVQSVSMSFVENLFTDQYWEVEVPKLGQSPLQVPGEVILPLSQKMREQIRAMELLESTAPQKPK